METTTNLEQILVKRYYLNAVGEHSNDAKTTAYLNAYLLSNFGIVVDKPKLLTKDHIRIIDELLHLAVPHSFYSNPQDMKHFTKSELFIEQLVSYILVESVSYFDRVDIFEKELPEYKVGDELKLREFKILDSKESLDTVANTIIKNLCTYTRPFSIEEQAEFLYLYNNGYYGGGKAEDMQVECKDNILALLDQDITFAHLLDQKDLIKLSINTFGDHKCLNYKYFNNKDVTLLTKCLPLVRKCKMSKKQAKYFNKIVQFCHKTDTIEKASNINSPYRLANVALQSGNVLEAAKVFAANGSLLERNLVMLLSRVTSEEEIVGILDLVKARNPIVLFQLISNLLSRNDNDFRVFSFYKNKLLKKHVETSYEHTWRKTRLSEPTKKLVYSVCMDKFIEYYRALDSLGKIYVSDEFYKLGLPSNTSAMGKGLDVLPTGSRLKLASNKIRTFVRWKNIYDIDASIIAIDEHNTITKMYFGNASSKPFDHDILFSGDDRSDNGAEYYDIDIEALQRKGYKYVIQAFHGYANCLNVGEVYYGYQVKKDFNTRVWDPKNIEVQYRALGDTRAFIGFAIDVQNNELIIINQATDEEHNVVNSRSAQSILKYLDPKFLDINIGLIIANRGKLVSDPAEADVVFSSDYDIAENQKLVKPTDFEQLVALVNGDNLN